MDKLINTAMAGNGRKVILPPELWNEVLLKLWQNDEYFEVILTCREVCRSWEELVDNMPPNRHWSPWLGDPGTRRRENDVFKYHPATSFTGDSDVAQFLSELPAPGSLNSEKNPFRNQTVRLFQHKWALIQNDVKNEEGNLLMILREYGHRIRKLLWEPHDQLSERLRDLPQLLSGMSNLRILILDCTRLSQEEMKSIRGENFPTELRHLRELIFKSCYINRNVDDTMYGKLSVNFGQQIKSITFNSLLEIDISKKNVLDCFSNLEDLKVEYVAVDYWALKQPSGNPWPKLRRLALMNKGNEGSVTFENVLRIVRCFSESLELLCLAIGRGEDKAYTESRDPNRNGYNLPAAVFPKVEELIIPLSTMYSVYRSQPSAVPIERRLNFRLPSLKSVVLMDMKNEFGQHERTDQEIICGTLWPFVPASVETISVRNSWKWNLELQKEFPISFKCSRNPV